VREHGDQGARTLFDIVRRWLRIRGAKREIAKLLVHRLPSVKVFPTPGATLTARLKTYFLIVTETESQADELLKDYPRLYSQLCDVVLRSGYSEDAVRSITFPIMSQETLARDCGGSWQEAMEYGIICTD
jgi:hypothetical protein